MDVFGVVAGAQRQYLRDAAVRAADGLRLWSALPATAEDAAATLHLRGARRLRRLLDALALFGFVRRSGEVFHELFHAAPGPVPDGGWGRLAEVIRSDLPIPEGAVHGAGEGLQAFHDYLFETGAAPARELWERLAAEGPLLDLGGGSGAYSAAFPDEVTLADTPAVLRLSRAPRATQLAIDLLNTDLDSSGHGVVLLANVLHLFGEADCRAIVRKAAAALRPQGLLVVKDLNIEPDRSGPAESVLFALNMALFTAEGDVHDRPAIETWLRDAGLGPPREVPLTTSPGSLVLVCAKP